MAEKDITQKILEANNDVFADIVNGLMFNGKQVVQEDELQDLFSISAYENEAKLEPASSISAPSAIPVSECYLVTSEAMKEWGLENVKLENKEYYLIKFDDTNATVEIYNTLGYDGKYSLTEIDNIE